MIVERKVYKEKILKDIRKKMVLLAGPRQAGKTFLAREILKEFSNGVYLNYDFFEHREIIKNAAWSEKTDCLVLDELHKMADWKNFLKGVYDTSPDYLKIIVTGSARLDYFRQTGDSLAGRYFFHHLFPFSLSELHKDGLKVSVEDLLNKSCFPEPFLEDDLTEIKRWRNQYVDALLREDALAFEKIDKFNQLKLIFELLRRKVGSPISFKSIAEDVQISVNTVKRYIAILENFYVIFRVTPFSKNIARAILKEPKIYFFDTGLVVGDDGARFENLAAFSLLKHTTILRDFEGEDISLHYLKTKDGKEIDFCLVKEGVPLLFIESKFSEKEISPSLKFFHKKYGIKSVQVVKNLRTEYQFNGIEVLKAENFLKNLYL